MHKVKTAVLLISGAVGFGLCGAAARATFVAVETRWQMAAFILAAACVELIATDRNGRVDTLRFVLNASAAVLAISVTKWLVEGAGQMRAQYPDAFFIADNLRNAVLN